MVIAHGDGGDDDGGVARVCVSGVAAAATTTADDAFSGCRIRGDMIVIRGAGEEKGDVLMMMNNTVNDAKSNREYP